MKDIRKIKWELFKKFRKGEELIIKPTTRCNFNCAYCSVNKAKGRQPIYDEMPWQYWVGVAGQIRGFKGLKSVTISGGDHIVLIGY
jgi:molybdenum cofactor biosynthesis enzyme MoaA